MAVSNKWLESPLKKGPERVDERLIMLCDGIFAIAITILVLDIKLDLKDGIDAALNDLFYKIIIYIITFFVIAGYWSEHRSLMKVVKRMDSLFLRFTFLFLAFVTFFPVAFNMIMDAGDHAQIVIIYTLIVAGGGLSMSLLWWYASWKHRLIDIDLDAGTIFYRRIFGLIMPTITCLSLLLIPFFPDHPQRIFYSWLLLPVVSRVVLVLYTRYDKKQASTQQYEQSAQGSGEQP